MPEIENIRDVQRNFLNKLQDQGKSFNTIKNYRTDLECFNQFLFARQKGEHLRDFNQEKVKEYTRFIDNKYNSDNSKRRRVQALRLFFDFLVQKGYFSENPIRKIPVSPKVLEAPNPTPLLDVVKLHRYLTEQVQGNQGLSKLTALRNLFVFHLIYGAALKVSDIAKLKLSSIIESGNDYRVLVTHPKRDSYTIPLFESFDSFYKQYKAELEKYSDQIQFENLLFNANPYRILSGGLSPRGIELSFKEIREKLNIHLTPKSLRQSCIFRWLGEDVSHITIKEWMGVTPGYSLNPYLKCLQDHPQDFHFVKPEQFSLQ